MKELWQTALQPLVEASEIHSATAFTFAGQTCTVMETGDSTLIAQLSEMIYQQAYARPFTNPINALQSSDAPSTGDLLDKLVAANTSRERLDAGWQILNALDNGQVIVEKNGRTRLLQPGQYLTHGAPGQAPRTGQRASVFVSNGSAELQPGFYFVFGETLGDQLDEENIVRFYWHLQADGAAPLIRALTQMLNRWQAPFRFKTLRQRGDYQRTDAAVLYVNRRYVPAVALLLADIYREVAAYLRPETPLFTKRLADGLGLAEDPGNGESFGQHRCRLLAEALWLAHEKGLTRLPQRLAAVAEHFAAQGLNLATPYLNARSTDVYEFVVPASAGSARRRSLPVEAGTTNECPAEAGATNCYLETAAALAAQICREALWAGERCNWLGPSYEVIGGQWTTVQRAYGPDVYSGTSGIALFLGRLYALTGERLLRATAEGALAQCLSRLEDIAPTVRAGFYSGWAGIAYTLAQAAEIFAQPRYGEEALRLLRRLLDEPLQPEALDVIAGSAGAIQAALALHAKQPQNYLLKLADKHGRHLLATARRSAAGCSWRTMEAPRDLTGYAHGAAGIGLALLELHCATGAPEFREVAEAAFAYERHWFDAQRGNWPDFRAQSGSDEWPGFMLAWCHGAPGGGLARLRAWELTGAEQYRAEAEAALATTMKALEQALAAPLGDCSLCHGLTGRAELLLSAAQILARPDCYELAARLGEAGIEQFQQPGLPWPCGVPQASEAPALLPGLAGIGYFYLRLFDCGRTPSFLSCLSC